ncbi:MAG TPA: amidohydrolase family protein [Myxococcota bacterium]|nr:amidohydrolase family protein [Myxococcota bacterium]
MSRSGPDEEILEPALAICDAHHHLWKTSAVPGWKPYQLAELLSDTSSGHNVTSTVFVECLAGFRETGAEALRPVGETEFVERTIEPHRGKPDVAAAIVGFADLSLGARVREVLEAHLAASPRFRGIRHATNNDPKRQVPRSHHRAPPGLLGDAAFRDGIRQLVALDLSFDAWVYHPQLAEVVDLARAFPDLTIVLDHLGGVIGVGSYAGRRDEIFAEWRRRMDALAECENVHVKLGGLHMELSGFGWEARREAPDSGEIAEQTRRYHLHAIERFGVRRCMFESNFPVDSSACSYRVLWNAFKRIASGFTPQEKAALFHDTAAEVYRISPVRA